MSFSIGGVEVSLQYSFFLVVSLFLLWDQTGWASLMLLSIALHELAHIAAMRLLGVRIVSLTLCPFGVNIQKEARTVGYGREALVYLAGPLCNLLLCGGCVQFQWREMASINLVMGLFQLIPVQPMDGGQLLDCLAGRALSPGTANRVSMAVGLLMLTPLAAYAIYLFLFRGNFTLLILCASLLWKNWGSG